jgi:hypothetical protein
VDGDAAAAALMAETACSAAEKASVPASDQSPDDDKARAATRLLASAPSPTTLTSIASASTSA